MRAADAQFDAGGTINSSADVVSLPNGGFAVSYNDNGWTGAQQDITTSFFNLNGVFQTQTRDATAAGTGPTAGPGSCHTTTSG